jgi:hypothetical protein
VQLVAIYKATREAVRDKIWAQFAEVGLGPEAQDASAEEDGGELPLAAVEDVD